MFILPNCALLKCRWGGNLRVHVTLLFAMCNETVYARRWTIIVAAWPLGGDPGSEQAVLTTASTLLAQLTTCLVTVMGVRTVFVQWP